MIDIVLLNDYLVLQIKKRISIKKPRFRERSGLWSLYGGLGDRGSVGNVGAVYDNRGTFVNMTVSIKLFHYRATTDTTKGKILELLNPK